MVACELRDPLPEVRLDDLEIQVGVVLLEAPVQLDLLGRHALGLGYDLSALAPRQVTDVADDGLPILGEKDVAAAGLDVVRHLLQIVVEVRHGLLLYAVRPLPELRGLRQGVQDGVARRDGLAGKELDRVVELLVLRGLAAPLVEAFDPAHEPLVSPVLRLAPAGRLLRLHLQPPFFGSSTWARCRTRVSCPVRCRRPLRCIRQLESPEIRVSAPLFSRAFISSSAIAVETAGILTEKVPPNPQQSSSFSQPTRFRPSTFSNSSRGSRSSPSSRRWWQPVWKTAFASWWAPRSLAFAPITFTRKSENSRTRPPRASERSRSSGRSSKI